MFTVSLIAAPGRLPADEVAPLARGWSGGGVRWLAEAEAAEFDVPALPESAAHVRAELGLLGIDVVIQPAEGRRKRLLVADMDSTLIGQECIDELADEAGVGPRVAAITARAMNGELDFEGALRERVGLLEGLPEAVIGRVLAERITLAPGAEALVATMRAAGGHTLLVSGGFTAFTEPLAARIGFDAHRANVLLAEAGRLTGRVAEPILGREAKVAALRETAAALGLTPADAIAVGDGANDLGMLGIAGTGVALHAKPVVQELAPHVVNHGDLTALLYLQGYAKAEFSASPATPSR